MQTIKHQMQLNFGEDLTNKEIIDRAIQRASTNADPEWKELAMEIIMKLSRTNLEITADDVWEAGLPETRENRALGGVMRDAAKRKIIQKTNMVQNSRRVKHNHARPIHIWKCLL